MPSRNLRTRGGIVHADYWPAVHDKILATTRCGLTMVLEGPIKRRRMEQKAERCDEPVNCLGCLGAVIGA